MNVRRAGRAAPAPKEAPLEKEFEALRRWMAGWSVMTDGSISPRLSVPEGEWVLRRVAGSGGAGYVPRSEVTRWM